jgi:RNA polymerase sigma-70 factor, ECF subfamily
VEAAGRSSSTFRAALAALPLRVPADGVSETAWRAYLQAAAAAWPDLPIAPADFIAHVASGAPPGGLPPSAHAGDLLLAFACARGVPAAIGAFHESYDGVVARVLARRRAGDADAADVSQVVYERLLVAPPGGAPKIADYRGMGPLRSWISTTVATTLLMTRRAAARRDDRSDESALASALAADNPELLYMKSRYREQIEGSMARALSGIPQRDRALLKLHLVERMSIDQLAVVYGVNRATAARWLAKARADLLGRARDEIQAQLGVSQSECDSLVDLVRSNLHLSVARHLSQEP